LRTRSIFLRTLAGLFLVAPLSAQQVWLVNASAPAGGDGMAWGTAFDKLQPALQSASIDDEIWVAVGTYVPSHEQTPGSPRTATFELPIGISVYGGFDGSETRLEQRAGLFLQTILSGDLGANGDTSDNAYHVVLIDRNPNDLRTLLDGFTIEHGNATGPVGQPERGAGIYATMDLTLPGFGVRLDLKNCTLRKNVAVYGSAITADNLAVVRMTDCRITSNSAAERGGAILVHTATLRAHNSRFDHNFALKGGAVFLNSIANDATGVNPRVRFVNCLFHDNEAYRGGAVFVNGGQITRGIGTFLNCTVANNSAKSSGGAFFALTGTQIPAILNIHNSIIWNNYAPVNPQLFGPGTTMTYTDILGGWEGNTNFNTDPLFLDEAQRDYHTRVGSRVHDAGDNGEMLADVNDLDGDGDLFEPVPLDMDGEPRFKNDPASPDTGAGTGRLVDLGAYEF
jgi:predicted outer membrane repeat protein